MTVRIAALSCPALALALLASGCDSAKPTAPAAPTPAAPAAPTAPVTEAPQAPETPPATPPVATPPPSTPTPDPGASIGSARMQPDGTLVLQLRAEGDGILGDALLTYPPNHAEYATIKRHVGPIEPGQERPVPPFPDEPGVWRYRVLRSGQELGVIEVKPGEVGTLTLSSDSDDAKRLAELWREIESKKSFHIKMHTPAEDGERGPLGAKMFRVGDADYPKAVHWKLLDAYYDVGVLAEGK